MLFFLLLPYLGPIILGIAVLKIFFKFLEEYIFTKREPFNFNTERAIAKIPPVDEPQTRSNLSNIGLCISNSSFLKKLAVANPRTPPPSKERTYLVIKFYVY